MGLGIEILFLAIMLATLWLGHPTNQKKRPGFHYIKFSRGTRETTIQINLATWNRLIELAYNQDRAERLVIDLAKKHRGRGGRWLAEKAIRDLERDRK